MKPVTCPDEAALGEILDLPADDPRRRHVDSCPRCRSLVLAHGLFQEPPQDDEAERAADQVAARLDAFREDMISPAAARTTSGSAAGPPLARSADGRPSWWRRLFAAPFRPAWALAAVAVVSVIAVVGIRQSRRPEEILVRGTLNRAMGLVAPEILADGAVRLVWRAAAEPVDGYELVLFSPRFETLARIPTGPDTSLTLAIERFPAPYRAGELLFYRVDALVGRDVVAQSQTGSLQKPQR
mgnify:CR=1 FL=1